MIAGNDIEPTFHQTLISAGYTEEEIGNILNQIRLAVIETVIKQVESYLPYELIDELATLPDKERIERIFQLAPEYVSKEEVAELEHEAKQKLVEKFYNDQVKPRLRPES